MALGPNFPPDIVQARKTETPGGGGTEDDEGFPSEVDPDEDGIEVAGIIFRHPGDPGNQDCYLARNAAGDLVLKDKINNSGNEILLASLGGSAFGGDFDEVSSLGTNITSSSSPQNKLTLVTGALTGTYMVFATFRVWNTGDLGHHRLWNDTDSVALSGLGILKPGDADVRELKAMGTLVTFVGVAKTFIIQWNDQSGGNDQFIDEARLMIWKVKN